MLSSILQTDMMQPYLHFALATYMSILVKVTTILICQNTYLMAQQPTMSLGLRHEYTTIVRILWYLPPVIKRVCQNEDSKLNGMRDLLSVSGWLENMLN